jgi:hypothetical protein
LDSALRVTRNNPTASGFPFSGWKCVGGGIADTGTSTAEPAYEFNRLVFVNVATQQVARPRTERECSAVSAKWGTPPIM